MERVNDVARGGGRLRLFLGHRDTPGAEITAVCNLKKESRGNGLALWILRLLYQRGRPALNGRSGEGLDFVDIVVGECADLRALMDSGGKMPPLTESGLLALGDTDVTPTSGVTASTHSPLTCIPTALDGCRDLADYRAFIKAVREGRIKVIRGN
jgi:hypothetical protein